MKITTQASSSDANKDLFYCYGCGRGGDVIRFAELYHQVKFPQAVALLRQWRGVEPVLQEAVRFYRIQLIHRHSEAFAYLYQRGIRSPLLLIEQVMRIGYAPGGCLRGWLTQLGHSLPDLCQARPGDRGCRLRRRIQCASHRLSAGGQSLWPQPFDWRRQPAHRFLPGAKGGLYAWKQVQSHLGSDPRRRGCSTMPCCEQAGFQNVTLLAGNPSQLPRASFGNSATLLEPSIWPSTPTRMAVVSRPRNRLSRRLTLC